jgi:hypothetical protein
MTAVRDLSSFAHQLPMFHFVTVRVRASHQIGECVLAHPHPSYLAAIHAELDLKNTEMDDTEPVPPVLVGECVCFAYIPFVFAFTRVVFQNCCGLSTHR